MGRERAGNRESTEITGRAVKGESTEHVERAVMHESTERSEQPWIGRAPKS